MLEKKRKKIVNCSVEIFFPQLCLFPRKHSYPFHRCSRNFRVLGSIHTQDHFQWPSTIKSKSWNRCNVYKVLVKWQYVLKFIFGSFIQFSDHLNKSFYCWRWTILVQMQSHPNIFVVLIITVRKTFSYLHHLKNLRMDLIQNLNQWQSLPVMDLPLIYNPKIKSIQTKKNKKK